MSFLMIIFLFMDFGLISQHQVKVKYFLKFLYLWTLSMQFFVIALMFFFKNA